MLDCKDGMLEQKGQFCKYFILLLFFFFFGIFETFQHFYHSEHFQKSICDGTLIPVVGFRLQWSDFMKRKLHFLCSFLFLMNCICIRTL